MKQSWNIFNKHDWRNFRAKKQAHKRYLHSHSLSLNVKSTSIEVVSFDWIID
ncbi:hypothetical protein SAMN04515674_102285 [Pseudarcicella hirudinis]|uniref:Uncharacterized protein n=1 Tax=Pseudarcicella hirudinis TaxID=1079859 RepID=A0A1I5P501_9BACT|nr:hypothetical protein SAMN04515674_102285 [Pseudarcicella hirudinis]